MKDIKDRLKWCSDELEALGYGDTADTLIEAIEHIEQLERVRDADRLPTGESASAIGRMVVELIGEGFHAHIWDYDSEHECARLECYEHTVLERDTTRCLEAMLAIVKGGDE